MVTGAPGGPDVERDPDSLLAAVAALEAAGTPRKEAVVEVARRAGRAEARGLQPGPRRSPDECPDHVLPPRRAGLRRPRRGARSTASRWCCCTASPSGRRSWRAVAPLLHAHGLRTLAPDQRGYSPGARPRRRRDYRLDRLVADVVALVDEVGRPVHLVGHDWGAVVAWVLAATRPDLVRTLTAVSVPHPAAFVRAALTSRQGLRSWYTCVPPAAVAARAGGEPPGRSDGPGAAARGHAARGRRALPPRGRRRRRAAGRPGLVPRDGAAARRPAPGRRVQRADDDGVERRRHRRGRRRRAALRAVGDRAVPARGACRRVALDPDPGAGAARRGGPGAGPARARRRGVAP